MGRKKLERYEQNRTNPLVIQQGSALWDTIKGQWKSLFFQNEKPIIIELACGRGEYTTGLGQAFSEKNFIGMDIKGSRIWVGASKAVRNQMQNVAFLRGYIQNLNQFFENQELSEIWITFADPRPRKKDARRRLTHPRFMGMYASLLEVGGTIHLKTDNTGLFQYTLLVLEKLPVVDLAFTEDLYESPFKSLHLGIKTKYEAIFTEKGEKIKYLQFRFSSLPTEQDLINAELNSSGFEFPPAAYEIHDSDEDDE